MLKDAFYFPHFSNARHDRKIKRMTKELGIEGYGIFFMVLEILREQLDFKYPLSDIDLLSDEIGTSEAKVKVVVCNYQLFEIDAEQRFFSPKLITYLQPYMRMREQRRLAGTESGKARKAKALSENSPTTVERPFNERLNENEQSKVKEVKNKIIKENRDIFTPPTLDDIKNYITEKSYSTDPLSFYNYFSEGNWTDSKGNKVKNWKQKLITWESHSKKQDKNNTTKKPGWENFY